LGAKGVRATVRVFGCEPERADDAYRSLKTGLLQTQEASDTIADGLRASLAPRTFAILRKYVDGILLVSEEEIRATMRLVWQRMKVVIEPSSAVALAPLLREGGVTALGLPIGTPGRLPRIGVILSGGNVEMG
jgi:threonine dehydratase